MAARAALYASAAATYASISTLTSESAGFTHLNHQPTARRQTAAQSLPSAAAARSYPHRTHSQGEPPGATLAPPT